MKKWVVTLGSYKKKALSNPSQFQSEVDAMDWFFEDVEAPDAFSAFKVAARAWMRGDLDGERHQLQDLAWREVIPDD